MVVTLKDTPKKAPLEKAVQGKIMKYLRNFKKFSGDVITKGMYGGNGISDIVGCYNGQYVGIEIKRDAKGKPTPQQRLWLAEKEARGGICGVAHSINCVKLIFRFNQIDLDNEPTKS